MTRRDLLGYERSRSAAKWGLLAILVAIGALFWPNLRRRIERQVSSMAESISHDGFTVNRDWLGKLSANIHENCSNSTTEVAVEGIINEAMSPEQIVEGITQVAAGSTPLEAESRRIGLSSVAGGLLLLAICLWLLASCPWLLANCPWLLACCCWPIACGFWLPAKSNQQEAEGHLQLASNQEQSAVAPAPGLEPATR